MNRAAAFWIDLLGRVDVRNHLQSQSLSAIQRLIDLMEEDFPHDSLSPHYDWLVALRNTKRMAVRA